MTWTAIWSDNAKKELKRLPSDIQKRILDKTDDVEENPFQYLERLTGRSFYKYRVGNYRIIVDVVNDKLILYLLKVKKRSRGYK
ncbi:type II toxin-antitoxin system RelE/ParE family toxin [Nitrosopumilus sp.]|uniref:type II toxin-antitoxin system RelE family toxin n=1 Tax=Nitrosopumilus sp. TaxID=2024843 RepID=UPI00292CFE30|nr:type II toxin-antitoxin system RelE/ParE family toxin [Nitrosopumilus sp.]